MNIVWKSYHQCINVKKIFFKNDKIITIIFLILQLYYFVLYKKKKKVVFENIVLDAHIVFVIYTADAFLGLKKKTNEWCPKTKYNIYI